jgi:hypothetical protein
MDCRVLLNPVDQPKIGRGQNRLRIAGRGLSRRGIAKRYRSLRILPLFCLFVRLWNHEYEEVLIIVRGEIDGSGKGKGD